MAKRFTENQKWEDMWFRKLPPVSKLFWLFVVDKCDIAGFWNIDWELASFYIGAQINDDILMDFEGRLERMNNNGTIWVVKFIQFQYGHLNPAVNMHRSVISILKKKGLLERVQDCLTLQEGLKNPSGRVKDKDKDKDKDNKDLKEEDCKGEGKIMVNKLAADNLSLFEKLWAKYPNKDGKKEALRHFQASVKTESDMQNIETALINYLASDTVKQGFIKNGSTWFNNWRDWVSFAGVGKKPIVQPVKYNEDTEFLCADCHQVTPKTEREYGEDSLGRCRDCHKKYMVEWNRKYAEDMQRIADNWQRLSNRAKQYQIDQRVKMGLPILPWMTIKEEIV